MFALGTGFCGCCTTFSGWQASAARRLVDFDELNLSASSQARALLLAPCSWLTRVCSPSLRAAHHVQVMSWLVCLIIGASVSFNAHHSGLMLGTLLLDKKSNKQDKEEKEREGERCDMLSGHQPQDNEYTDEAQMELQDRGHHEDVESRTHVQQRRHDASALSLAQSCAVLTIIITYAAVFCDNT